jgi:hypothetical protein
MPAKIISTEVVTNKIYIIRGEKVMLDRDLAELYGVKTQVLNQAIRRNKDRFPKDFMFSLTRQEIRNLSQIVISSAIKHAPNVFVFTEQGVAMLSGILRSKKAVAVNIAIMRAFVRLRQALSLHKELAAKLKDLEQKVERHDADIHAVFEAIRQLMREEEKPKTPIGFHAQKI